MSLLQNCSHSSDARDGRRDDKWTALSCRTVRPLSSAFASLSFAPAHRDGGSTSQHRSTKLTQLTTVLNPDRCVADVFFCRFYFSRRFGATEPFPSLLSAWFHSSVCRKCPTAHSSRAICYLCGGTSSRATVPLMMDVTQKQWSSLVLHCEEYRKPLQFWSRSHLDAPDSMHTIKHWWKCGK